MRRRGGASRPNRRSAPGSKGSTPTSGRWPRSAAATWWSAWTRWDAGLWRIEGLNDSKQVKPEARERMAVQVKSCAVAWTVQYVAADVIDAVGMTASLVTAFRRALAAIEEAGVHPDVVLLDGNPLHMDDREVNVVKGDCRCASIAAASIVAKADRDGFEAHKGYASPEHIEAIRRHGLTPVHRVTFCTSFMQATLF